MNTLPAEFINFFFEPYYWVGLIPSRRPSSLISIVPSKPVNKVHSISAAFHFRRSLLPLIGFSLSPWGTSTLLAPEKPVA